MQLMVGVMALGLILALAAKVEGPRTKCGKRPNPKANLVSVASQLDIFKLDHGRYPDSLEELVHAPSWLTDLESYPQEGYFRELPVDNWGHKLLYRRVNSPARPFVLLNLGADGREGGEGPDADISY
ncbi:MAG TPA: type II secretion system protein GspG [Planctomycetota bacterium]|nr:type II secretion system protein GspG [Planctomycetota bacterium]